MPEGEPSMTDVLGTSLESLRTGFSGRIVQPDDADYDAVRAETIWNGAIDRRPALIARCTSASDVSAALRFARSNGLEVSVRGGGHNFAGSAICEGGVMIDLGPMNDVRVDVAGRVAVVGGGARWADLDAAAQEHGLACPGGFISHTGIAGLTLGGGVGWLSRKAGLSSDNLVGADIVTADGEVRRASAEENPDLFWAIRGGGGNFGVVTSFEFRLHEVGPIVQLGLFFWELEDGTRALRAAREIAGTLPEDQAVFIAGLNAPPAPFVPEQHQGAPGYAVIVVGYGTTDDHVATLDRLREAAPPLFEFVTPIPFTHLQQMFDESAPWGIHGYEKAVHLEELSDGAIDVITRHMPRKSSPMSFLPIFCLGGAFSRAGDDDTAFGGRRSTRFVVNIAAIAPDRALYEADREWVRSFWDELVTHAPGIGSYVNFMSEYEEDRIRAAYGPQKYERLAAVKAAYDPGNVFHLNPNIKPSGA